MCPLSIGEVRAGLSIYGGVGTDWAGRYFFNQVGENVADIAAVANPVRVLAVSNLRSAENYLLERGQDRSVREM